MKPDTFSIELNARKVEYTLRTSRRLRRLRLAVYCDGNFVVTAPTRISPTAVEHFIIQKSQWVLDKLDYFTSWRLKHPGALVEKDRKDKASRMTAKEARAHYAQNKKEALVRITEKVAHWNAFYNFSFNAINVKNQKTRWGSCSQKGNLNFNYKIAAMPERMLDYVVVHELCHLGEFNHSRRFWALVAKAMPDYAAIRKEMKGMQIR